MSKDLTTRVNETLEEVHELSKLLDDRISDCHEVKGLMQARHAYIYYRSLVWKIRDDIRKIRDKL